MPKCWIGKFYTGTPWGTRGTLTTPRPNIARLNTLLDKQDREINNQDTIIERIEEFYTELYDSEHSIIIHTDPKEVQQITSWEVEAAL